MKKMASILLIVFFALAVIGRLSSFFDRVQYQGISQDPSYRSLQVEQKLTPEQLKEYGVQMCIRDSLDAGYPDPRGFDQPGV